MMKNNKEKEFITNLFSEVSEMVKDAGHVGYPLRVRVISWKYLINGEYMVVIYNVSYGPLCMPGAITFKQSLVSRSTAYSRKMLIIEVIEDIVNSLKQLQADHDRGKPNGSH